MDRPNHSELLRIAGGVNKLSDWSTVMSRERIKVQAKRLQKLLPEFAATSTSPLPLSACQELMARVAGYSSFHDVKEHSAGDGAPPPAIPPPDEWFAGEHGDRRRLQQDAWRRLSGLSKVDDPHHVVSCLADLCVAMLAKAHPAQLLPADRKKIRANYGNATDDLIDERAMTEEGLMWALAISTQVAHIAIDNSASSHCKEMMGNDDAIDPTIGQELAKQISSASQQAKSRGMSAFGVACTAILVSVVRAKESGVRFPLLVRPLLDSIDLAAKEQNSKPTFDIEEDAVRMVAAQLGISIPAARKYAKQAKKMMERGEM